MRGTRTGLLVLAITLIALSSCAHDDQLKAKRPPHEFVLPPSTDPSFATYPTFPDKTMTDWQKKATDDLSQQQTPGTPKMPSRMGAGMSGPGMGGM